MAAPEPSSRIVAPTGVRPYRDDVEYLRDQLSRVHCWVSRAVERSERRRAGQGAAPVGAFAASAEDARGLLEKKEPEPRDDEHDARLERIDMHVRARLAQQPAFEPHLERLVRAFALSPFERDVLAVLIGPEIDERYIRLYAYLEDDLTRRQPSVRVVIDLLCNGLDERLHALKAFRAEGSLIRHWLVRFSDQSAQCPLLDRGVRLDDAVVEYIVHGNEADAEVASSVRSLQAPTPLESRSLDSELKARLESVVRRYRELAAKAGRHQRLGCWLVGDEDGVAQEAAAAVCGTLGLGLLAVDIVRARALGLGMGEVLLRARRQAKWSGSALFVARSEPAAVKDEPGAPRDRREGSDAVLWHCLNGFDGLVFFASSAHETGEDDWFRSALRVEVRTPSFETRRALWREIGARLGAPVAPELCDEFADTFRYPAERIEASLRRAMSLAEVERGSELVVDRELLLRGAVQEGSRRVVSLARCIDPVVEWDDLILPADRLEQLRELCSQVRHRRIVLDHWGFGAKLCRGRGISALFAGSSGTGKTMAAEVIARALNMVVFKVELASIVSKYIGETEKNLECLFRETEESHGVLFFDEADALFGKRTEVKDSHDRYANIEIDYLLQRIESFDGLAILSTNVRNHLDDAFTRRLRFCVEFPAPDEQQRLLLWQRVFPANAPQGGDIDRAYLAKNFKLSGGSIKNIALAGAFLAATAGETLSMKHLVLATRREHQKHGRLSTKAEFGRYYAMLGGEH
jgi:ATPase family associated with various cellular activities (AAA)